MTDKQLIEEIKQHLDDGYSACNDMFTVLKGMPEEELEYVLEQMDVLREGIVRLVARCIEDEDYDTVVRLDKLRRDTYFMTGRYKFEDFMIGLEYDRAEEEKFYEPRRRVLRPLVDALQSLADDELDELFLSMPPRVGKTTMCMWYVLWIIGRDPEASNLYVSYTDGITRAFYTGLLEVINDPYTYNYKEIFKGIAMPTAKNGMTNAQDETIDLGRRKRYHSITNRSLYGTLNGACDAKGILISDDLVGSIEEAMSKDRLVNVWAKVDNNMIPRAKEQAKLLWVGTRWSLIDPAGIRMDLLENDDRYSGRRYKIINLPALDENDESNFDYDHGVGFSTEFYKQRRASFERNNDIASWNAQYMGQPIEREGTVFSPEDMRYFNGVLPDVAPDRKFMAVDPAWGGGDYVASPICYQYGDDVYVVDVVYNNEDKRITQRLLAQAVERYEVDTMMIEASKTTSEYKDGVEENITTRHCTITTKTAPNDRAKWERVLDKAPDIREHFIFLEDGKRSRDYSLFMQNVYSFKIAGKNKNDDAPDSLCMAVDMAFRGATNRIEIFARPF